ncbi:MAG: hypothetical protein WD749_05115 [Phycisphaerales bacterium]
MTIAPRAALAAITGLALSAPALAQAQYEFFLVDAFNTTYSLREAYVTEINEQNIASGTATAASAYTGFLWTPATGKTSIPVTAPKGLNVYRLDNDFVFDAASSTSTTVPGVAGFGVPQLRDVSDGGLVVGRAWSGTPCSMVTCYAPLLWDAAGGSRLLTGVPNARELVRVNESGQVLGHVYRTNFERPEAFIYDLASSTHVNLGDGLPPHWLADFPITQAFDISDSGSAVGIARFGQELPRAFLWRAGGVRTLLPGLGTGEVDRVFPNGVNASHVVVGRAAIAHSSTPEFAYHAFIWDEANGMRDLNALTTPEPGFILDEASKINDSGWIVGYGHFGPGWGTARGFVLRPLAAACYANCDQSTAPPVLNVADFGCFLQRFAAADAYANCDQSTAPPVLNVADFGCFLQKFAAGCP